tara:strand:- start:890 stop:1210 length:321 start_codon:yes stop_codon:yes gene_type:complete
MLSISEIVSVMQQKFNASAANNLDLIYQFEVEDEDEEPFHLVIRDGKLEVNRGSNNNANLTLSMSSETLESMVAGKTDGVSAIKAGDVRSAGDVWLADKLTQLFPV